MMDVTIPQEILEALLGGGIIATLTLGLLEWLKSRDWWKWREGDILILFSVGISVIVALLFRTFGWFDGDPAVPEVIGFGFASGLGASILRDVFANVFQPNQRVTIVQVEGDMSDENVDAIAAAAEAMGDADGD